MISHLVHTKNITNIYQNEIYKQFSAVLRQSYPITSFDRPFRLQEVEASRISRQWTHESGKVVSHKYRPPLPPGKISVTHFCYRLSRPQCHSATRSQWEISFYPTGIFCSCFWFSFFRCLYSPFYTFMSSVLTSLTPLQHTTQSFMPPDRFEPATPASDRPKSLALDGSATGTGENRARGLRINCANAYPVFSCIYYTCTDIHTCECACACVSVLSTLLMRRTSVLTQTANCQTLRRL